MLSTGGPLAMIGRSSVRLLPPGRRVQPITVSIKLERHPRVYHPGEMLTGEYRWETARGEQIRGEDVRTVELSVMWATEGKGEEDFGVHFFDRISTDSGDDPRPGVARFSTQLPNSPVTYDGFLVKIRWLVRVRVFLKNGEETAAERDFRLAGAELPSPLLHKRSEGAEGATT